MICFCVAASLNFNLALLVIYVFYMNNKSIFMEVELCAPIFFTEIFYKLVIFPDVSAMSSGPSKRGGLGRQGSISSLEQSLNMVNSPPTIAPVTIYPGPAAKHANMAKVNYTNKILKYFRYVHIQISISSQ